VIAALYDWDVKTGITVHYNHSGEPGWTVYVYVCLNATLTIPDYVGL